MTDHALTYKMTLFNNQRFAGHIAGKHHSALAPHFATLQHIVELETRHTLETAIKFMRRDRRDILSLEDIETAVRELNHREIKLSGWSSSP